MLYLSPLLRLCGCYGLLPLGVGLIGASLVLCDYLGIKEVIALLGDLSGVEHVGQLYAPLPGVKVAREDSALWVGLGRVE